MFMIDMKFISKLFSILFNQSSSFSGPHLHKTIFQIYTHFYIKKEILTISKKKKHGLQDTHFSTDCSIFVMSIFTKIIFLKNVPIYFLILFEVFWYNKNHKYGAPGLGKSRNHEKSRFCLK